MTTTPAAAAGATGTILHLGAGYGEDLECWRAAPAAAIVLLEPNPDLLPELERRAAADSRIHIRPLAVAAGSGRATLHVLNLTERSSLRVPTGLKILFPGLREVATPLVQTIGLAELVAELDLPEDRSNLLVLDAPGEERVLIDQLCSAGAFRHFDQILLRAAEEPLYEDGLGVVALLARLGEEGYVVEGRNVEDPDFPEFRLSFDVRVLELAELRRRLADIDRARETERAEADTLLRETAARDEAAETRAATAEAALEKSRAELDEIRRAAEAHEGHIAELDKALSEMTAERDRLKASADKAAADLRSERAAVGSEVETARQDAALAQRLQSLRESDLRDLRQRYGTLQQEKTARDELLRKLTEKLGLAAQYLQRLEPELPDADAATALASNSEHAPEERSAKPKSRGRAGAPSGGKKRSR